MKKILAVDDSATVRSVLQKTLEDGGYEVILANDGKEALSCISTEGDSIDMVLTDLNMPNLNGIELIKNIRSMHGYRFKPIMMLTNEAQPELKSEGKAAGASCWVSKPFKPEQILSIIRMVLPA